jgi:hypothetical protein
MQIFLSKRSDLDLDPDPQHCSDRQYISPWPYTETNLLKIVNAVSNWHSIVEKVASRFLKLFMEMCLKWLNIMRNAFDAGSIHYEGK